MILTCPSCATQYSVDAARMDRPRRVRCSSCKTAWTQEPEVEDLPPESQLLGEDTPLYRPEPPAPEVVAEAAAAAADAGAEPVAKQMREKAKAKAVTRKAVAAGVVWGGLAASILLLLGAAAVLRVEVVRLIPSTAGAYAKIGLAVNPVGLAPEGVEAGPGLHNGHAAVIVTGKLRNVQTHAHPPAPLRVVLMDKGGHRLADQVLAADEHPLAPGEARPFQLAFLDPPSGVAQVQVEFAFDKMHARPAHAPKGHGKALAEAGHSKADAHAAAAHEALAHGAPLHGAPARAAEAAHAPAPLREAAADSHAAPALAAPAHGQEAHKTPAGLRGPAAPSRPALIPAKVAKPLPGDSPYALPEAARAHAGHG
jgi:predicted Zn finger-like uncharacterized protein